MDDGIELRTTFNSAAELYQKARPNYPEELFDALVQATHLASGAHLLEIGPGTGKATRPLARRGYQITGIELSEEMVKVARRELSEFNNVNIITGSFENVEFPAESFDLIYAAAAFHWIRSDVRFTKSHALLKTSGHLAVINRPDVVDEESEGFLSASQLIHDKYRAQRPKSPSDPTSRTMRIQDVGPEEFDERLFKTVFFKVFSFKMIYTAKEYIDLFSTFSHTIAMADVPREKYLRDLQELIETKFGGSVVRSSALSLTVGQRR